MVRKVLPSDGVVKSTTPDQTPTSHNSPEIQDLEKQRSSGDNTELINASKTSIFKSLGWLDRFLAMWIFLAMLIGILLGNFVDNVGPALQKGEFVGVSIPIGMFCMTGLVVMMLTFSTAVGLLVMMYPILCKVKYETLHHVFSERAIWVQIGFSIVVNWIVAPLLMVCAPSTWK